MTDCESCAKNDAKIRRALLLFRNLPSIEPSADFSQRLEARLRRESQCQDLLANTQRNLRRGAIVATLASAAMLGYIATTLYRSDSPHDLLMPPVVASIPEPFTPITNSTPAIVTSVSAGLTIWPAALFAEQIPVRFAHSRLELVNYKR